MLVRRFPHRPTAARSRLGVRLLALTAPAVAAASAGTSAAAAASAANGSGASRAANGSPATGAARTTACALADIKPSVIGQPQRTAGATRMAIVELTNVSTRPCQVEGWASVALVNAAGDVVVVASSNVAQPGAPVPVDLPPGASASSGIKWTVCDKASADCPTGNTLMVGVPKSSGAKQADLSGFPAAASSDVTMKTLEIGSLQPSAQGVVAW